MTNLINSHYAFSKRHKEAGKAAQKTDKELSNLSWNRERFCLEYVKDGNATRSAIRAGFSKRTAHSQGHRLLKNVEIKVRIGQLQREAAQKLKIEHHVILKRLWDIATGDVNDLVRVEHRACRYCYGADHEYQWKTKREFQEHYDAEIKRAFCTDDLDKLIEVGRKFDAGERIPGFPSDAGGYGYDPKALPHPDCPECGGEGTEHVAVADTREALSHPLYEGVKQTKDGIEIKIADRAKALEQVARHLQMFMDEVHFSVSDELRSAARAISAASPPLTPEYAAENAHRLNDLD